MSSFLDYIWIPIKVLFFGASITLQPSSALLTQHPKVFTAPSGSKLEAINEFAALYLQTDTLDRMNKGQLIEGNIKGIANDLSLSSIEAFLVHDGKRVCQLRFVGFGISKTSKEAIYGCKGTDISGMQFSEIIMKSSQPLQVTSIVWQNSGK
ncbi:MAG: hypothetical protein ACREHG_05125 [Candidatus Saccharimonadales bacterium]